MRRFIILCVAATLAYSSAYAWWGREHATVAQIAENNLTPKAKALMKEYFGGKPMAYYAAHADHYRNESLIDIGFEQKDGTREVPFSHGYYVDEELKPLRDSLDANGMYLKNSVRDIVRASRNLKENHHTMNDSVRLVQLYCIIHTVGDLHCPVHAALDADSPTPHGKYRLFFRNGDKQISKSMHGLWEMRLVGGYQPWGCGDLAKILGTWDESQIAECCRGDVYAWGEETAHLAYKLYNDYKAGEVVELQEFHDKYQKVAERQITKAGYRLAKLLNEILN